MPRWALASLPVMSHETVVDEFSSACSKVTVPLTVESPRTTATVDGRVHVSKLGSLLIVASNGFEWARMVQRYQQSDMNSRGMEALATSSLRVYPVSLDPGTGLAGTQMCSIALLPEPMRHRNQRDESKWGSGRAENVPALTILAICMRVIYGLRLCFGIG